ncbi:Assembly factor cbp4 [Pseudocercospora fuligena]|uniref:Cytochrome b mRNA-processing protein 4 n=1 Tax=Pseudocercospora fuligena TaxID=685502 RepID=A0A8H6RAG6_9PEZI|nr:Assembly factor cbp4 [Pseudocercospora fuligena]
MRTITWVKMALAGGVMCVGGPALIYYVTPSEEELFLKYNPELQRRSLERRKEKQEDFDQFVNNLKRYSKSEKPIWTVQEEEATRMRREGVQAELDRRRAAQQEAEERRMEIKNSLK